MNGTFEAMTTATLKKVVYWLLVLVVGAFVFSRVGYYFITKDAPFMFDMVEQAKASARVQRHIGGYTAFKHTYNEHDLEKDTLPFRVWVYGRDSTLELKGLAIKKNQEWVPIQVDSAYVQVE
ncbi:hypothetical protein [Hymenobacter sedentarius]|nr:hypothetical protein [Hymenobacter sedentarius]